MLKGAIWNIWTDPCLVAGQPEAQVVSRGMVGARKGAAPPLLSLPSHLGVGGTLGLTPHIELLPPNTLEQVTPQASPSTKLLSPQPWNRWPPHQASPHTQSCCPHCPHLRAGGPPGLTLHTELLPPTLEQVAPRPQPAQRAAVDAEPSPPNRTPRGSQASHTLMLPTKRPGWVGAGKPGATSGQFPTPQGSK